MDSFEWNKVFGAVLGTALIIIVINNFSETLFHEDAGDLAYTIEVAEAETGGNAEAVDEPTLAELLAVADPSRGERLFSRCKACHVIDGSGKRMQGPGLYNVLGRDIASYDGYGYTSALDSVEGTWTYEKMDAWLAGPKNFAPGTSMALALTRPAQRAEMLAYLRTQNDNPPPLPEVPVEAAEEAVEEVVDAVADGAEDAADAVSDAAEDVVDTASEASEEVVEETTGEDEPETES